MTATLLGEFTVGDAVPGLTQALSDAGDALGVLANVVTSELAQLAALRTALDGARSALAGQGVDIAQGPLDEALGQLAAAQGLLSDLEGITDAPAALAGLLSGLNDSLLYLAGLVPADWLDDKIDAAGAGVSGLSSKVQSIRDQIGALADIGSGLTNSTALLDQTLQRLTGARTAADAAIAAFNSQMNQLLNQGVFVVAYEGPLASLGADVAAVLPDTGIDGAADVLSPVLVTETANAPTAAALRAAFGLP